MTHSLIQVDPGVVVIPQTISRCFVEANLKSKCPFHAFPLTVTLSTVMSRQSDNEDQDWQKVEFTDEFQFVLGTDDNHVRVWRCSGKWYNSPTLSAQLA